MDEKNRLKLWHGVLATVLAILFMLFGGIPLYALFGDVGGMLAGIFLALIGVAFVLATRTKLSEVFPMRLPPVRQFFASIGICIGVTFLNSAIGLLLAQVIPNYADREAGIDAIVTALPPAVAILLVAVQPAICEEFFCRGFLVASFRKIEKDWVIILITSLIFGALHVDLYAFLPTALLGAAFAFIGLRTGSLLLPILLHFGNNALSVVLTYLMAGTESEETELIGSIGGIALVAYLLLYLGLALFFLWFSGNWFLGRPIFTKTSLVVFIAASLLATAGYGILYIQVLRDMMSSSGAAAVAIPFWQNVQV